MSINTHPGEILNEDFLIPKGISPTALAKGTKLPVDRLREIIRGRRRITGLTDSRLCAFLGLSPGYWLRAQQSHDAREARRRTAMKTLFDKVAKAGLY